MKSVLISIKPRWCELIASGKKTVEVRKTKPKLDTPFKVYIYCTNEKPYLVWGDVFRGNWETEFTHLSGYNRKEAEKIWDVFNGKVIGEFVCDCIVSHCEMANADIAEQQGCIKRERLFEYANGKELYGWHISNLVIYDEPKPLSEFYTFKKCNSCKVSGYESTACIYDEDCKVPAVITRPPQSWCYVEEATGNA